MRTAFICVTVTVTSPLERIYISTGVTRRPFGFQPKGWCLSRSRNGSAHFRRYFAMGNIRGTPCMRSHICVHRATTKYFSNSFVLKLRLKRKDFQEILRLPWAQEVPSSNLGAPTTYFFVFNELSQILQRQKPNLGPSIASVVPRVQTISSGPRACTNFATVSLAFSYRVADRRASVCKLFAGFALSCR